MTHEETISRMHDLGFEKENGSWILIRNDTKGGSVVIEHQFHPGSLPSLKDPVLVSVFYRESIGGEPAKASYFDSLSEVVQFPYF